MMQVFQGDDLPPQVVQIDYSKTSAGIEAEPIDLDEMIRITSFAAQPIGIFNDMKKEKGNLTYYLKMKYDFKICLDLKIALNEHSIDGKQKQLLTIKKVNLLNAQVSSHSSFVIIFPNTMTV